MRNCRPATKGELAQYPWSVFDPHTKPTIKKGHVDDWDTEEGYQCAVVPCIPWWAMWRSNARCYKEMLDQHGFDFQSQHCLYSLGDEGPEGWKDANSLLGKIEGRQLNNYRESPSKSPSKWLHSSVATARSKINDRNRRHANAWWDNQSWGGSSSGWFVPSPFYN